MAFDSDWTPPRFVENQRVETEDGSVGIFARADSDDVSEFDEKSDLKYFNGVLEEFAKDQKLTFVPARLYYHDRFQKDPTILKMAHTLMDYNSNPTLNDVFFVVNTVSINQNDNHKTYVVRLNDRLQTTSRDLSVWEYKDKQFVKLRDVEGRESNNKIHFATNRLYRFGDTKEFNPFREIATTINPSLGWRASR